MERNLGAIPIGEKDSQIVLTSVTQLPAKEMNEATYRNAVVASGHRLASEAGLDVLKEGGNAVDAVVTTSLTLSAVLPPFCGIGGGGFLMLRLASGNIIFIDYREVGPSLAKPDMFQGGSTANSIGHLAIATPGTIKGLDYALEKYGTINLDRALAPGIKWAKSGIQVTKTLKRATDSHIEKLRKFAESRRIFLREGNSPEVGSSISFPELSETYARIAKNGPDEFYRGQTAQAILEEVEKNGGILRQNDLISYTPVEREPIKFEFGEYSFFLPPPPSAGGIQMAQALEMLEDKQTRLKASGHNSYEYLFVLSKVLGATFADRSKNIADPDFFNVDVEKLLSFDHLSSIAPKLDAVFPDTTRSTSHMCAADAKGNVAALTESIECFYGSGVVPPGTGVLLNDTMHDFDVNPASPNSIAPEKTPLSSMSPTIICKSNSGKPFLTCGSAGGPRIVSATFQTALNVILFEMGVQEAISAPRFHYQGGNFIVESRVDSKVLERLKQAGYNIELLPDYDLAVGGVQGARYEEDNGISVGADPRREAIGLGF